jgi:phosphomethylpyrimidine synthase
MSARLAAHIGDMIKYGKRDQDLAMGHARKDLDWARMYELALDPEHAKAIRASRMPEDKEACTMCGDYCALKIVKANLNL